MPCVQGQHRVAARGRGAVDDDQLRENPPCDVACTQQPFQLTPDLLFDRMAVRERDVHERLGPRGRGGAHDRERSNENESVHGRDLRRVLDLATLRRADAGTRAEVGVRRDC